VQIPVTALEMIRELEAEREQALQTQDDMANRMIRALCRIRGVITRRRRKRFTSARRRDGIGRPSPVRISSMSFSHDGTVRISVYGLGG
jgi:hypothetical protein